MKEEEFTVYKAVRVVGGNFVSSVTGHPAYPETKAWELGYVLGEKAVAHEGSVGILCFGGVKACAKYLDNIPDRLRDEHRFAILECTTTHVPHRPFCILRNTARFSLLVTHRREWQHDPLGWDTFYTPPGTVVVPSLTPLRVYNERRQQQH